MAKKTQSNKGGLIIAGVAVAGAIAGYFLYGPDGASNRKKVRAWSLKAKADVLEKVEKAKELSREQYNAIVDKATERYAKVQDVSEQELSRLNKELKRYWQTIQAEIEQKQGTKKKATKKTGKKKSVKNVEQSM